MPTKGIIDKTSRLGHIQASVVLNRVSHGVRTLVDAIGPTYTVCIIIVRYLDEDKDEEAAPQKKALW